MVRKLIFMKHGMLYDYNNFLKTKEYKECTHTCVDVDIQGFGFKELLKRIENNAVEYNVDYLLTTCPTLLRSDLWWNEEKGEWEVYFIEKDKIVPISEYTDKWLRKAHNLELVYLNGGLDIDD